VINPIIRKTIVEAEIEGEPNTLEIQEIVNPLTEVLTTLYEN
jgi:hypothetical protein